MHCAKKWCRKRSEVDVVLGSYRVPLCREHAKEARKLAKAAAKKPAKARGK